MRKDVLGKVGLAVAIVLAPGGFILGATLATRYYRRKRARAAEVDPDGLPS